MIDFTIRSRWTATIYQAVFCHVRRCCTAGGPPYRVRTVRHRFGVDLVFTVTWLTRRFRGFRPRLREFRDHQLIEYQRGFFQCCRCRARSNRSDHSRIFLTLSGEGHAVDQMSCREVLIYSVTHQ